MAYDTLIGLWAAVVGARALVRIGRYAVAHRRVVRQSARVVRVPDFEPGPVLREAGVPAELAFVDPAHGREAVGMTRGGRYGRLDAVWEGREVPVRYVRGRPQDFLVEGGPPWRTRRELVAPLAWLFLALLPLPARFAPGPGFGWVLLASGAAWALATGTVLGLALRETRRRAVLLAAPARVTGTVVAVLERHDPDKDDRGALAYTPVVAFTTDDGRAVTALSCPHTSTRRAWVGCGIPIRYAPADPSVFALDRPTDHPAAGCGLGVLGLALTIGLALTACGALLLTVT